MIKKILCVLLAAVLTAGLLSGCSGQSTASNSIKKINIVATTFAPYDLAKQVAGDKGDVTMLLPPGSESHSYEPTPQDIKKIVNCDVFIYVGGDSDAWVTDILSSLDTSKVKVITLMDCVDLVEEELKEGMTPESEEEPAASGEEEVEYDEHVWTSPRNAIKIADKIAGALEDRDADNAAVYKANTSAYDAKLTELDGEFKSVVANAKRKTVVFGDRFPLRYFVDAYGLDYFAAFPGCSSDTEASASTVAFLIDKVKAEKIPVVFTIELSNGKIADTICEATGAKKLQWNACHNVTADQFKAGVTYLDLMKQNVSLLKEALN